MQSAVCVVQISVQSAECVVQISAQKRFFIFTVTRSHGECMHCGRANEAIALGENTLRWSKIRAVPIQCMHNSDIAAFSPITTWRTVPAHAQIRNALSGPSESKASKQTSECAIELHVESTLVLHFALIPRIARSASSLRPKFVMEQNPPSYEGFVSGRASYRRTLEINVSNRSPPSLRGTLGFHHATAST